MKFRNLSLQKKLVIILFVMVITPTVILGILSYITFRDETYTSVEKELVSNAKNWKVVTDAYVQEEDRVLKREEVLVKARLESTALLSKKSIESAGSNPTDSSSSVYKDLGDLKIGRKGYVFVVDSNNKYILSAGHLRDGKKITSFTDEPGQLVITNILGEARKLSDGATYTATYDWQEVGDTKLGTQIGVFKYSKKYDLVVGVVAYYSDFKSTDLKWILEDELRTRMSAQKIKGNGYVWTMNSKGEYLVSKNKLRDGENILDTRDESGTTIIKNSIDITNLYVIFSSCLTRQMNLKI